MGVFEQFPYTNFHDLNIDALLKITGEVKDRADAVDAAVTAAQTSADNANDSAIAAAASADAAALSAARFAGAFVTPEYYGAVGDGATDDTAAMAAALASGHNVYCEKSYLVDGPLTVNAGQLLFGTGTLIANNDANLLMINDGAMISGLTFTDIFGSEQLNDSAIIKGLGVNNVIIEKCKFDNIHLFQTIRLGGNNLVITNNHIDGYQESAITITGGSHYLVIKDNKILNGHSTRLSYRYPITIAAYSTDSSAGATKYALVSGNYIEDSSPYWEGIDSHACENVVIENNYIKGVKAGIVLTIPTSAPYVESNNIVVKNNVVYSQEKALSIGFGGKNFLIEGNVFESMAQSSDSTDYVCRIYSQSNSYTMSHLDFINNTVISSGGTYGGGIYASNNWANVTISGNSFDGGTSPNKAVINLANLHSYSNVKVNNNTFGAHYGVNRCFRGPTSNANTNNDLVEYLNNKYITFTERARDITYTCCPRTSASITQVVAGKIGDWQPNTAPSGNSILGWYATTDSDPANNVQATWTPITF